MRVVHVAPTPFGDDGLLGGGERYPVELARAMARHVDVELVTFGRNGRRHTEDGGLRVTTLRRVALLRGHPVHPLAPGLARAVAGAGVVHTHHTRAAPSRMAAVVARALRRPAFTTDHGLGGGGWAGLLPALFARHLTVSAFSARTLGLGPERVRVVYGGADPDRFHPDSSAVRRGALFVGRLTPHKGVDVLLRALPAGVPVTLAGSEGHDPRPPERDYPQLLRSLAAGRDVAFAGPVPDGRLPDLYRSARVLVLPSVERTCYGRPVAISELLGLAAIEAMACATPVVASRVGGLPEVVRDGETGLLVDPGDAAQLRDAVARLAGDGRLAGRMGRAGAELVRDELTWDACARRCLAAYDEVLSPTAAR